jgi:putative ABC transport system substrate-binding protein
VLPKRLELISELAPQARVIALLVNPNSPIAERMIRDGQEAARAKGVQLHILKAGVESERRQQICSAYSHRATSRLYQEEPLPGAE